MGIVSNDTQALDIKNLHWFAGLPEEYLDNITTELIHYYRDGDVIFEQAQEPSSLGLIVRGEVQIVTDGIYLVSRGRGQVIGEQAFINGAKRNATAIAIGAVEALIIPRAVVDRLMESATFTKRLLQAVSAKLTEATEERAYRYRHERLLFGEFRAHLAPEIANRLLSTGKAYGEPRCIDAVVLFSDIRSFTERSAGMEPLEIAKQLTCYLDATVDVIHDNCGMVDKFIGDAVMAIWGFIPGEKDLALRGFKCAEEMVRRAPQMTFGGHPIEIGIGLNAGKVFVGNVGGSFKRQFTVLGSAVNLASRFESASKVLQAPIVMGNDFYSLLPSRVQDRLMAHVDQQIKGAANQILYSFDPGLKTCE